MNEFLTAIVNGLGVGSIYALLAIGYAFIFRTTASFNFAQGQLLTVGSLFAYTFYTKLHFPALLAAAVVMLVLALVGGLVERVAIYPLSRRGDETLTWLISTLGAAVLITGISQRIWGTQPLGVKNYFGPAVTHLPFNHVNIATSYVIGFGVAIVSAIAIECFQRFTLWGRAMKAVGDNRNAIELAGINVVALGLVAFLVGGALAGLGGFVLAPVTYASANGGFSFAILAFSAVAIGGFASHWGALFGGLFVGIVEQTAATYIGLNYQDIIVFGVLIVILLIRPQGILTPQARTV